MAIMDVFREWLGMRKPIVAPLHKKVRFFLKYGDLPVGTLCSCHASITRRLDSINRRINFLTSLLLKPAENLFRCDGKIADADAGGVVNSVGDGRGHGYEWRFA